MYAAKYDTAGTHTWSEVFRTAPGKGGSISAVGAVDFSGDVVMTGTYIGELDFPNATFTTGVDDNAYIARLKP